MQTLAFVSQKGGSGKTTLAVHLASEAALEGERVLLIDLDPQGSATLWARQRGDRWLWPGRDRYRTARRPGRPSGRARR